MSRKRAEISVQLLSGHVAQQVLMPVYQPTCLQVRRHGAQLHHLYTLSRQLLLRTFALRAARTLRPGNAEDGLRLLAAGTGCRRQMTRVLLWHSRHWRRCLLLKESDSPRSLLTHCCNYSAIRITRDGSQLLVVNDRNTELVKVSLIPG